ncbi:hypothetical protein B0H19DRAFT_1327708 [Mycena capillaripes]|nr:hypothetical protein B0H19DRAFT_1327708 [Mycena capillaripes]
MKTKLGGISRVILGPVAEIYFKKRSGGRPDADEERERMSGGQEKEGRADLIRFAWGKVKLTPLTPFDALCRGGRQWGGNVINYLLATNWRQGGGTGASKGGSRGGTGRQGGVTGGVIFVGGAAVKIWGRQWGCVKSASNTSNKYSILGQLLGLVIGFPDLEQIRGILVWFPRLQPSAVLKFVIRLETILRALSRKITPRSPPSSNSDDPSSGDTFPVVDSFASLRLFCSLLAFPAAFPASPCPFFVPTSCKIGDGFKFGASRGSLGRNGCSERREHVEGWRNALVGVQQASIAVLRSARCHANSRRLSLEKSGDMRTDVRMDDTDLHVQRLQNALRSGLSDPTARGIPEHVCAWHATHGSYWSWFASTNRDGVCWVITRVAECGLSDSEVEMQNVGCGIFRTRFATVLFSSSVALYARGPGHDSREYTWWAPEAHKLVPNPPHLVQITNTLLCLQAEYEKTRPLESTYECTASDTPLTHTDESQVSLSISTSGLLKFADMGMLAKFRFGLS